MVGWFQDGVKDEPDCDVCAKFHSTLQHAKKLVGNTWTLSSFWSDNLKKLNPGDQVMGDLDTLGWVIVKATSNVDEKLLQFLKDIKIMKGINPFLLWHSIQHNAVNKMHWHHLIVKD